jgi:O-antigen ligase
MRCDDLVKKSLYILTGLVALLLGVLGAAISIKIVLALAAGVLLLALILLDYQRATYLVALFLVLDYVFRQVVGVAILASIWDDLLLICCFALWVYKWFINRREKAYVWTPLEFPLIIFFGVSTILLLIAAPDIKIGIEGLRAVIQYMFWYFVIVQLLRSEVGVKNILYILIIMGAAVALYGIYQYLTGVPMPVTWIDQAEAGVKTRAFSIVGSPNILGSLMVLLLPVSISLFFAEKQLGKKLIFLFCAAVMGGCLIVTYSRGAWMGFLVAAIVYVLLKDKRLIVPLLLVLAAILILVPSVGGRISYMISPDYIVSSLKGGRLGRWGIGIERLMDSPWFGVGLGQFGGAVAMNNNIPGTFYMDNYYLKTVVEMGIVGLGTMVILFYNAVIWSFRALKRVTDSFNRQIMQGAIAGMCGVLVHNFVENIFEVPMMVTYFWLMAGFIMYLGYVDKKKNEVGEDLKEKAVSI